MALVLTGTAGLFTRVGKLGILLDDVNLCAGVTVPDDIQTINDQYIDNEAIIDGMAKAVTQYQSGITSILNWVQQTAQSTVITMVTDDVDLRGPTLSNCLSELIRQMNASGALVRNNTLSLVVTPAPDNTTDGQIVGSLLNANGVPLEDAYNEDVTVTVTADALTGGATLGQEQLLFQGQGAASNMLTYSWPSGSGGSLSLRAVDAASSSSNYLTNGGFETWTVSNVPDSWTVVSGTPGVTIFESTSPVFAGTACLRILGNGSQNTCLQQIPSVLTPLTQFAVNFWIALSGVPAAGVLEVALVSGTGAYINDQTGTANVLTVSLPVQGTPFAAHQAVFRTPLIIPTGATLQFKLTTPLSAATSLYLDQVGFKDMQPLYSGGPFFMAFSGTAQFTQLDRFTVGVSNSYSGNVQSMFQRLFRMSSLGLLLPASASYNIPDTP